MRKEVHSDQRHLNAHTAGDWWRGFLTESRAIYDFERFGRQDFLSDFARFVLAPEINGHGAMVVDDKVVFEAIAGRLLPVPRVLGRIDSGVTTTPDGKTGPSLADLLRQEDALVLKPRAGGGGAGIYLMRGGREPRVSINGEPAAQDSVLRLARTLRDYIVCELFEQGEYARDISPSAVNTVRVVTMVPPDGGEPFIATAIHRFGTERSAPVDNWTRGGLSVAIDLSTGEMGRGATYPFSGRIDWHERHPDTGAPIAGVRVPQWSRIAEDLLSAASALRMCPYLGWDVIAREDRFAIVEANSNTDVNLLQVHGPLLADPRVRAFYEHYGVVPRGRG